jgi:glucose uptake protein GlcU
MLLAMIVGLTASAIATRTPTATALAYGAMFAITLATLLPLLASEQLAGAVRHWLLAANPFTSAIQLLTTDYFSDLPELWPINLKFSLGVTAVCLIVAYARVRRMLLPDK